MMKERKYRSSGRRPLTLITSLLVLLHAGLVPEPAPALAENAGPGFRSYADAALVVRFLWFEDITRDVNPCSGRGWDLEDAEVCCERIPARECISGGRTVWLAKDVSPDTDLYRGHAYTVLPDHRIRVYRMGKNLLCGLAVRETCFGFLEEDSRVRMDCRSILACEDGMQDVSIRFRGRCYADEYCEGMYRMGTKDETGLKPVRTGTWVSRIKSRWRKPVVDIVYTPVPEEGAVANVPSPSKIVIGKVEERRGAISREKHEPMAVLLPGPFPAAITTDTSTVDGVAAGWIGEEKGLAVAIHDSGERLVVGRKEVSTRVPGAVERISWVSPEGEVFTVYLGAHGLPIRAEFGDIILLFDNYREGVVDITVVHGDGGRSVRRGVPVRRDLVQSMEGFARGWGGGADLPDLGLLDALKVGALALGIAGCASAAIVPGFVVPCAAVLLERILDFAASDEELLLETSLSTKPIRCSWRDLDSCAQHFLAGENGGGEDLGEREMDCSLPMVSPFGCESDQ